MRKLMGLLVVSLFLPLSGSAQVLEGAVKGAKEIKEVAQGTKEIVKVPKSRELLTRYQLSLTPLDATRASYDEKVNKILSSKIPDNKKIEKITALTEKTAPFLATLLERNARLYSQWGKELLKERDPKFLPPRSKMPQIPELFSPSERVEVLANPNTVSPRFFREWTNDLVEPNADVPLEVEAMITSLSSNLETADMLFNNELAKQRELRAKLSTDRDFLQKHIEEIFNSQMRLSRLAITSARDVTDLIFLCNLYPTIYEEPLAQLAARLDILNTQTPFTRFIRRQLNVPERIRVRGFRGEEPFSGLQPVPFTERPTIGFRSPAELQEEMNKMLQKGEELQIEIHEVDE